MLKNLQTILNQKIMNRVVKGAERSKDEIARRLKQATKHQDVDVKERKFKRGNGRNLGKVMDL